MAVFSTNGGVCESMLQVQAAGNIRWFGNVTISVTAAGRGNATHNWTHVFFYWNLNDTDTKWGKNNTVYYCINDYCPAVAVYYQDICTTGNLTLGKRVSSNNNYFNGSIKDFRINNFPNTRSNGKREWLESPWGNGGKAVPVISFHRINNENGDDTYVNNSIFASMMQYLYVNGYQTVNYDEWLLWRNNSNTTAFPNKPIIITFDDNHISQYQNTTNVMDQYGFYGVIAVPPYRAQPQFSDDYINWTIWNNVLLPQKWQIAVHSNRHVDMTTIPTANWTIEFNDSRWDIFRNTSYMPSTFIFPFNADNTTLDLECAKYYTICTSISAYPWEADAFIYKNSNLTFTTSSINMGRLTMRNVSTLEDLKAYLDPYYQVSLDMKFHEGQGNTTRDSLGNNGTIYNAKWQSDYINVSTLGYTTFFYLTELTTARLLWSNGTVLADNVNGAYTIPFYSVATLLILENYVYEVVNCDTYTRVGYRLIGIIIALLMPLLILYYVNKKGWENLQLGDIVLLAICIIVGSVLYTQASQQLGGLCGVIG